MSGGEGADVVMSELARYASPERAKASGWFFKTGKGQYGEGDQFIGVTVPDQRKVARTHKHIPLQAIHILLSSPIHEHRLTGLLILCEQYQHLKDQEAVYHFYMRHKRMVNSWDLVDVSAPRIVGTHLLTRSRVILYTLARSQILWDRRIAIISTFAFIAHNDYKDTLAIAEVLLGDKEDLIHKAVGWMLREVGKRDVAIEKSFLDKYACIMPRTMLRYSIEHFSDEERKYYLYLTKIT